MSWKSLRAAFPLTVPVLVGYLCMGAGFGLLLDAAGYNIVWSFFMSLVIYAGSGQYLGVSLMATGATLGTVAFMTLVINLRHLVYGLSMLEKFKGVGLRRKLYMIFTLTDETYALLAEVKAPPGVNEKQFYFSISFLDHLYWVAGSVLGSVVGALLNFNTTGVEFAMTALFLAIAVEQWKTYKNHVPALLGAGLTVASRLIAGAEQMLIPALVMLVTVLLPLRGRLEPKGEGDTPE